MTAEILLTALTATNVHADISQQATTIDVSELGTAQERNTLILEIHEISYEHNAGEVNGSFCAKTSSISSVVAIEHQLVCDRQTDRHRLVSR